MTFEQNLARLEEIAAELEDDHVQLDRALHLFEEGVQRLRDAAAELARAEARVKQLVQRPDGTFELSDFGG